MPWDWENGGIQFCIRMKCKYLKSTFVGSGVSECYQKGGIHYYCASEDEMCSGCTAPVKIDKRRCLI